MESLWESLLEQFFFCQNCFSWNLTARAEPHVFRWVLKTPKKK
jgi:hypothetical protein